MKKLYFVLVFLCMAFALQAQDSLRAIGWITYPADVDWATTTHEKLTIDIKKAPSSWTFDESTFDLKGLWNSLGTVNEVKKLTDAAGGVNYAAGTFGAEFKAFYDAENMYVCLKYNDKEMLATSGVTDSRSFEIMYQTKYADRYEPGWTSCQTTESKNEQYARFLVLGGGKSLVTSEGFKEFVSSSGVEVTAWNTGKWLTNPNIADPAPVVIWDVDANNTIWCTVQYNFTDHMYFLDDIYGGDIPENRIAFNPAVKNKISFDVKANALIDSAGTGNMKKDEFFWNSSKNDGFEAIYFNGYINFLNEEFTLVGVPQIRPEHGVYISGNVLRLKGVNEADIQVYSSIGQLVKSARKVSELNLGELPTGIYLVRLNNEPAAFKIMKR